MRDECPHDAPVIAFDRPRLAYAAHALGLVHRDVKPANILLEQGGAPHAYRTDLGSARPTGADTSVTPAGAFIGTVDYAAPEQQRDDGPLDGRADVYALGGVLYHALAGHSPYERVGMLTTLHAHAQEPRPRVSQRVPELAAFEDVIRLAMAIEVERRHQTAGELAADAIDALRRGGGRHPRRARAPQPRSE